MGSEEEIFTKYALYLLKILNICNYCKDIPFAVAESIEPSISREASSTIVEVKQIAVSTLPMIISMINTMRERYVWSAWQAV
jgi:hypothetical protein